MVQELNQSNIGSIDSELNLLNTMPFGDASTTCFPFPWRIYKSLATRTEPIFDFANIIF
jgi:hypothetical protein